MGVSRCLPGSDGRNVVQYRSKVMSASAPFPGLSDALIEIGDVDDEVAHAQYAYPHLARRRGA
jgi:hypothetical protein